jgi:hypothetical protein
MAMEASLMSLVVADMLRDVWHYSVRYEKENKNKRDRRLERSKSKVRGWSPGLGSAEFMYDLREPTQHLSSRPPLFFLAKSWGHDQVDRSTWR